MQLFSFKIYFCIWLLRGSVSLHQVNWPWNCSLSVRVYVSNCNQELTRGTKMKVFSQIKWDILLALSNQFIQIRVFSWLSSCNGLKLETWLQGIDDPSLDKVSHGRVLLGDHLLLDNGDRGGDGLLHLGGLGHRSQQVVQLLAVLLQSVPSLNTCSTDLRERYPL